MLTKLSQIGDRSAKSVLSRSKVAAWSLKTMERLLRSGNPAATIDRFFTSRHVTDLQLIIAVAFILLLAIIIVDFCVAIGNQVQSHRGSNWEFVSVMADLLGAIGSFLTLFSSVFVIFGAIAAWAYQVASARLGVVDLFACEISTLCRVAVVADTVRRQIDKFNEGPGVETFGPTISSSSTFTSQENYFPVFEGNIRDLQTLEARVVVNITAFYTYMKVVRDSMRSLPEIRQQPVEAINPSENMPATDPWHEAARNVLYMFFLGFESARRAVADLVEFEPERAERIIVILISELEAYRFLLSQFRDEREMRHERIILRAIEYRELVPNLCDTVAAGRAREKSIETEMSAGALRVVSEWEPAWRLLPELRRRYEAAMLASP